MKREVVWFAKGAAGVLLLVGAVACGSDDGGSGDYGDPIEASPNDKALATGAVTSVQDLQTLATTDAANESALGSVTNSYARLQSLVGVKASAAVQSGGTAGGGAAGGIGSQFGLLSTVEGALDAGCYTTDGTTTTYNNCDTGGFSINGSIGMTGETLTIDLTISGSGGGGSLGGLSGLAVSQKGSLTFTPEAISGELNYDTDVDVDGSATGGSAFSTSSKVKAIYDVLLTDGCPTGGSLEINQVTTADVSGLSGVPAGIDAGSTSLWVKAEFGPNCGDVTLY